MKIVVEDANILLDLVNGGILGVWLGVGYTHYTSHLVWAEICQTGQREKVQPHIDSGMIQLHDTAAEDWEEIACLAESAGISIPDGSVWHLARRECAILLSGDGKLRRAAQRSGLEVRGVLWVLDELVERSCLTEKQARIALEVICNAGAFLPQNECEIRFNRWKEG